LINGVDDLLAEAGPERVLELFQDAQVPSEGNRESQAQFLGGLADEAELFHTLQGDGYARISVNGHREIWMIRSTWFRQWLIRRFYESRRKPPGSQALQDAIGLLEARSRYEGSEVPLHVRVAGRDKTVYIDLCDAEWRAVEITPDGWRILADPPVHFRRAKGMLPLPCPQSDGSIESLRGLINVGTDSNWILCASWIVAAFRPTGPYPILILQGEQGSAKSTMEKILRRIVDPSVALVRTPPRDERDLLIAANNSWVIAYDNLSGIPHWLSDSLCRLATGGGFSTRELYTDSEEIFFEAMRPVLLNGIDQLAERADLADRALVLNLPRISDSARRDEAHLYAEFELSLPRILGAIFTATSVALSRIEQVNLVRKPRMADFALWAAAAEPALGFAEGSFMETYDGNRAEAVQDLLESDPIAGSICSLLGALEGEHWEGSCKELLARVETYVSEGTKRSRAWPHSPRGLSGRLRRLATVMRESGIEIAFGPRGTNGQRTVVITKNVV